MGSVSNIRFASIHLTQLKRGAIVSRKNRLDEDKPEYLRVEGAPTDYTPWRSPNSHGGVAYVITSAINGPDANGPNKTRERKIEVDERGIADDWDLILSPLQE